MDTHEVRDATRCDTFLIGMPIFGPIVRKAVMSRFARTFGILMRSGLPHPRRARSGQGRDGKRGRPRAIDQVKGQCGAGQGITSSFRATGKFPEMVLQLMSTGEESGELDAMLLKTSEFYDRQVEASVHGLTSLIEPVMIVLVGAMIGVDRGRDVPPDLLPGGRDHEGRSEHVDSRQLGRCGPRRRPKVGERRE